MSVEGNADNIAGKVKEGFGEVTGDKSMKAEGKADQASGKLKNLADDAKDMAHQAGENIKTGWEKLKDEVSGDK